jgi:hypothetical protein
VRGTITFLATPDVTVYRFCRPVISQTMVLAYGAYYGVSECVLLEFPQTVLDSLAAPCYISTHGAERDIFDNA